MALLILRFFEVQRWLQLLGWIDSLIKKGGTWALWGQAYIAHPIMCVDLIVGLLLFLGVFLHFWHLLGLKVLLVLPMLWRLWMHSIELLVHILSRLRHHFDVVIKTAPGRYIILRWTWIVSYVGSSLAFIVLIWGSRDLRQHSWVLLTWWKLSIRSRILVIERRESLLLHYIIYNFISQT